MSNVPIETLHLFPELTEVVCDTLAQAATEQWHRPATASGRTVHEVATHLIDGSLRRLAIHRDKYVSPRWPAQIASEAELLAAINRQNDEWTAAAARLSPEIIVALIAEFDAALLAFWNTLDPCGEAIFPVAWTGEERSENWFDIAREYTEKWHHIRQILAALEAEPDRLESHELMFPVLDTFARAVPASLNACDTGDVSRARLSVNGDAGGDWVFEKREGWLLDRETSSENADSVLTLSAQTAWTMYTTRTPAKEFRSRHDDISIEGDEVAAEAVLSSVAMMV